MVTPAWLVACPIESRSGNMPGESEPVSVDNASCRHLAQRETLTLTQVSHTPILDCEQPVPPLEKRWGVSIFLGIVLGVGLVALNEGVLQMPGALLLLDFLLSFYVAILVHELGHAAAGIATGFELRGITVGPLFLARRARGWRFLFIPRR